MAKPLEELVREIGHMVGDCIPEGMGFTLLLFEFGGPGSRLDYISSARRDDMVRTLRQAADMIEGGNTPAGKRS